MSTEPFANAGANTGADAWVTDRDKKQGPEKRFAFNIPVELHRRVKLSCVQNDQNMTDVIVRLLQREFPETADQPAPASDQS